MILYDIILSDNKEEKKDNNKLLSKKKFKQPTVEEVSAYVQEKGYNVDAEHFVSYYESNGWKVGRNPMKDWKAAVRTWAKNGTTQNNRNNGQYITNDDRRRAEKARRDEETIAELALLATTNERVNESGTGEFNEIPY